MATDMQALPFTIDSLHAAYADGMSAADVIDIVLARLEEAADPGIFLQIQTREALLAAAAELGAFDPAAKPLWGIPFAVKDNIDVAGVATTAACREFAYVAMADAPAVALLKAAGAIFVGKTNLDQFATGLVGVRTPYPAPRNALDPLIVPGGSSSGSAVATARRIVSFALGTDTAGSGRVPAALNDIVGLKPSLGALSTRGVVPACRTLDCVSIFAMTIDDAWAVLSVAAAYDAEDPYSQNRDVLSAEGLSGIPVVGIPSPSSIRFFGDTVQEASFIQTVERMKAAGVSVVEIDFNPLYAVADMLYEGAWVAERLAAISDFIDGNEEALHPVTRGIIGGAKGLSAVDAFKGFYRLQALKRDAETLLAEIDMLCVPTIPTFYTLADLDADPIGPNSRFGTYTNFVNLLDMCGIAVPTGKRSDGRPASVTILARGGRDRQAAEFARLVAGAGAMAPLSKIENAADAGIEIVVVGAHLTGMPLNHELLALRATFRRAVETAPSYDLFALPGTVPAKPGLLRVAEGTGTAIAVEVWSLSPAGFASFVSAIPAPLGIGRIVLADGTRVQGFLVESIATEGAENVSHFGGWKNYAGRGQTAAAEA